MKIAVLSLISFFVVMLSFQNCQKSPHPDELSNTYVSQNISSNNVSKVDLQKEQLDSVNFIVQDTKPFTRGSNTIDIKFNKTLHVDLETGIILETSDLDSNTASYCMPDDLMAELQTIVKSAQVCKIEGKAQEGAACTQALVPPYAQLLTDKDEFNLGSATDGCGSNKLDLCGEQSNMLKAYLQNLKAKYQGFTCPQ